MCSYWSGRPDTFNSHPVLVNIPITIHIVEHTAVGTVLFKALYTDENPADNLTVSSQTTTPASTYLQFNTTSK